MIIFQITLTGVMLKHLAVLKRQHETGVSAFDALRWDGKYVTTTQSLINQGLATHEKPTNNDYLSTGVYKFREKGRRFPLEITEKGLCALQLAAYDLKDFVDEVSLKRLPAGESYSSIYGTAGHPGLYSHKGRRVDDTATTEDGAKLDRLPRKGRRVHEVSDD